MSAAPPPRPVSTVPDDVTLGEEHVERLADVLGIVANSR